MNAFDHHDVARRHTARQRELLAVGRPAEAGNVPIDEVRQLTRRPGVNRLHPDVRRRGRLVDVADSTASVEKRITSTVAPQALFMLNSPFVLDQTKALASRILLRMQTI